MHTDTIMKEVWLNLARDFDVFLPKDVYKDAVAAVQNIETNAMAFRDVQFPGVMQADPTTHKIVYQMASLFKRYIFSTDQQPGSLGKRSISEFIDFQSSIKGPRITMLTHSVLQEARKIVSKILGNFCAEEHAVSCQFGARANRGVPKSISYLDVKAHLPSGSPEHVRWFNDYLAHDAMLARAVTAPWKGEVHAKCHPFELFSDLALTAVPKSWKSARIIVPNTVIGAFHSYGLGLMIAKRLALHHDSGKPLDISRLQHVHGVLARKASQDRKYVTADMSKASDSFSYELVARLVPRRWLKELKLGRISYVSVNKRQIKLNSFMAMGIGYTFPLQTLLFYALIKATQNLLHLNKRISVYGDDLIYHRSIHKYVCHVFTECGFRLNPDKTFVDHDFRESCGHDYFRGFDVRPYQPEFVGSELKGRRLSVFLYKAINGLTRRWPVEVIPRTYWYLLKLVQQNDGLIYQVPCSFPDYAGVKVVEPQDSWFYVPWSPVKRDKHGSFIFRHLKQVPGDRVVMSLNAYYWSWHRNKAQQARATPWTRTMSLEELFTVGWDPECDDRVPSAVAWRRLKPKIYVRSKITGKRFRKTTPVVPDKQIHSFRHSLQTIPAWF